MTDNSTAKRGHAFVGYVLERMKTDNAFAAHLRRADNPTTAYQSWEILAPWCKLDTRWDFQPFATVGAALARCQIEADGSMGLGEALSTALSGDDGTPGREMESARRRVRRVLASRDGVEACSVLRSTLRLLEAKGSRLCYGRLLDDLLFFGERVKVRWAQEFYGQGGEE